jgi:hypothetical protein
MCWTTQGNRKINPRLCLTSTALPYFCTYSILIMFKVFRSLSRRVA